MDLSCGKWENFAARAPEWEKIRKKEVGKENNQNRNTKCSARYKSAVSENILPTCSNHNP